MKLKYDSKSDIFFCEMSFEEKDIAKSAGFRWNPDKRHWWTTNIYSAKKLKNYFLI